MKTYSLHPESIRNLFNNIALTYDLLNHLLSLRRDVYWRKMAVREFRGSNGWMLDIATGTGDVAIEMIGQENHERKVFGFDFSEPMLRRAKEKLLKKGLGTVADNISLGNPGITREQVERAAELVHAHAFITRLPRGYDEPLVERGQNLSQGQFRDKNWFEVAKDGCLYISHTRFTGSAGSTNIYLSKSCDDGAPGRPTPSTKTPGTGRDRRCSPAPRMQRR